MKRRQFMAAGASGLVGSAFSGCSMFPRSVNVSPELPPFAFRHDAEKPQGTMQYKELGSTGIKLSKFGFGSHMRPYLRPYTTEREWMIREAHELGINVFDVYDREHGVFQYEPMGKYLAPMINDVIVSIAISPYDGRNLEQEMERDLRLFGRDYIDMVRIHVYTKDSERWPYWEQLFKWKEEGKIRAVGVPIHYKKDLFPLIDDYPIDYVIFPYNFFMNIAWDGHMPETDFDSMAQMLRDRGIGVITMKPFAGDFLVHPLTKVANRYREFDEVNFAQAALKWVVNSGMEPDTILTGMYYPDHVYQNIDAVFNPAMSDEEKKMLAKVKNVAKTKAHAWLPPHYRFFEEWIPGGFDRGSVV